jgi:single-strand selective monofunctional uracil DNA glycosylase
MASSSRKIIAASEELAAAMDGLEFGEPVAAVYNPLRYASEVWHSYVERYASSARRVVFLGMNPGPWGMAQTGIPFGEIAAVRDWMGLRGAIGKPRVEHPKRPIEGFDCPKSEVSGRRLWGLVAQRFGTPDRFFTDHFVANYCPLVFMADTGRNITPDKLSAAERTPLFSLCDAFLRTLVEALEADVVVGVGKFAERRAQDALGGAVRTTRVASILHPSPASPAANRDWAGTATRQLTDLGIW